MMQWMIDGRVFDMADVADDETVPAGATRIWEFQNTTNPMGMDMAHPLHLHGRQFRVLGRSGGAATNALREGLVDSGLTDTVLVLPGETVRVQVTFSRHRGLFLYLPPARTRGSRHDAQLPHRLTSPDTRRVLRRHNWK
jgi:FtsP/CotA-like multicopper oxidase with cupredoxin domain